MSVKLGLIASLGVIAVSASMAPGIASAAVRDGIAQIPKVCPIFTDIATEAQFRENALAMGALVSDTDACHKLALAKWNTLISFGPPTVTGSIVAFGTGYGFL